MKRRDIKVPVMLFLSTVDSAWPWPWPASFVVINHWIILSFR
jgi:hypothetical protein